MAMNISMTCKIIIVLMLLMIHRYRVPR